MVLLESLSRYRPVIIFPEIKHIIGEKKGIFVSERNYSSLVEKIHFIKKISTNTCPGRKFINNKCLFKEPPHSYPF